MSFRLPSIFSRQKQTGNRHLWLLCLLLFLLSGVVSFWIFFPAGVLQQRLLQQVSQHTDLRLQGQNATKLFPPGIGLDLTVFPPLPELATIELTGVQITPVWGSLFSIEQKVHLQASLAGGDIAAVATLDGRQVDLHVRKLALLPLQQPGLPYRVGGSLTGQLAGRDFAPNLQGEGSFSLSIRDLRIIGLAKLGLPEDLFAGVLQLQGNLSQRRVNLERVVLRGGILELSGGGNILLGHSADQSRLNLNVRLYPTAATPESFRDLLELTGLRPAVDGSYLFRIGGTVAKPLIR